MPARKLLLYVCLLFLPASAYAEDLVGSADHALLGRYEGSRIVGYINRAFDEYDLILSSSRYSDGRTEWPDRVALEGTLTRILYQAPRDRSGLEVYRNYEAALSDAGFTSLYSCQQEECGPNFYTFAALPWANGFGWVRDVFITEPPKQRYLAAKLVREEGDIYVGLYVIDYNFMNSMAAPYVHLDIVELAAIENKMVVVEAEALSQGIQTLGHAAVYGIYFDTDKDVIEPESKAALDEVGRLLAEQTDLSLHVVGHSDNEGAFDYNLALSQKRAAAVVDALVETYGISRSRLEANGVGFLAPVASNRTEEGRAQNRRVELVERVSGL